ncbi:cysteine-rich receptor-like protein kinase 2 [Quercus suber]|uniref:Cysteine-rich receptor-like protein kinase 2 n=1 Tax=Quercus suber TaxID=58331 RepID=A0AAW0LPQ2_QUESU
MNLRRKMFHIVLKTTIVLVLLCLLKESSADPQINLLNKGCSTYTVADLLDFNTNLNATFLDLKEQLTNNNKSNHFATSQQARGSDPVYAMFQCRKYLSMDDCIACFNAATLYIRSHCNASNGARVTYDGCFLRYESNAFYDQTTMPGHVGFCGNRTASQSNAFVETMERVLAELQVAVPRIDGFFAAIKKKVGGGGGGDSGNNMTVYGVAQCVESASKGACQECLKVAYGNIERCLPETGGKAVDAGCFLRYSDTPFFAENQTTNITPFLRNGDSKKKKFIIGGGVGGVCLLLIIVFLVYWYKLSRKRKEVIRDGILGASELRGPVNYKYNVLKSATKNFSEENKLGEGGFGEVYKVQWESSCSEEASHRLIPQSKGRFRKNLIRLLGCCSKGPKLLLVYEYMASSSLDKYLFDLISLLTRGYTAPEYAIQGQLSEKVDAYSFGVVALEIISGQKITNVNVDADSEYLLERAWRLYVNDMHLELVDENLAPDEYKAEDVKKIIEIGLMCTQASASLRPTMSEVVVLLKSKGPLEHRPQNRPAFVDSDTRVVHGDTSTSTGSASSNATASNSQLSGR